MPLNESNYILIMTKYIIIIIDRMHDKMNEHLIKE